MNSKTTNNNEAVTDIVPDSKLYHEFTLESMWLHGNRTALVGFTSNSFSVYRIGLLFSQKLHKNTTP